MEHQTRIFARKNCTFWKIRVNSMDLPTKMWPTNPIQSLPQATHF